MKFSTSSKSVNFNPSIETASRSTAPNNKGLSSYSEKSNFSGEILCASAARDACVEGLVGSFIPVESDFRRGGGNRALELENFKDDPTWNSDKREKVKRFRFVICFLGVIAITLALMSRVILNITIVDMVKKEVTAKIEVELNYTAEELVASTEYPNEEDLLNNNSTVPVGPQEVADEEHDHDHDEDESRYDWSSMQQNILLGSFHTGYIPSMLFGGGIADKYGAKYPLFACVFGSFLINFLSPHLASYSIYLLISSRVFLGLLQGGMIPAVYELFNKWLTSAETSIFVPLIKVSLSGGAFMGTLLPGIIKSFGYEWPDVFYTGSLLCFVWSILWLPLATSTPQDNPFVEPNELHRIMRKKKPILAQKQNKLATINGKSSSSSKQTNEKQSIASTPDSIPWWLIISHPSVIALTFVKFTYNLGMEFWTIELAVYLRKVHDASTTAISVIGSGGSLLQMALITFVGWSARAAVDKHCLKLDRTSWRKVFQGISNFSMAIIYVLLALFGDDLVPAGFLIVIIHFFWMFGAGGESMVPYDLSTRYPATIMGFSHGISVLSGLTIPSVCGFVLDEDASDPESWNTMFLMLAVALTLGGFVFCLVVKAEPFLPGEKLPPKSKKQLITTSSV